ncbi:hypothetical protein [Enterococcus nangangensis]|uniref:hypothetical protein n=1 Tax=Enterococcus nangangensis TaxID=2559926 RepID=UPI0010F85AEE|nr:hypothetical protein [Enterococcus nangangensis]
MKWIVTFLALALATFFKGFLAIVFLAMDSSYECLFFLKILTATGLVGVVLFWGLLHHQLQKRKYNSE